MRDVYSLDSKRNEKFELSIGPLREPGGNVSGAASQFRVGHDCQGDSAPGEYRVTLLHQNYRYFVKSVDKRSLKL